MIHDEYAARLTIKKGLNSSLENKINQQYCSSRIGEVNRGRVVTSSQLCPLPPMLLWATRGGLGVEEALPLPLEALLVYVKRCGTEYSLNHDNEPLELLVLSCGFLLIRPSHVIPKLQQEWFSFVLANWQLGIPFQFLSKLAHIFPASHFYRSSRQTLICNVILSYKAQKEVLAQ
ncbi:hypothetical protein Pfo_005139 [Paulownia fortunei]|nr:hypothetical protein Pfo_005139 [Paulownia fortunei]